jgi:hypothetical protein
MMGNGDTAFVTGIPDASVEKLECLPPWQAAGRSGNREIIAYEAFFLGKCAWFSPANRLFCA